MHDRIHALCWNKVSTSSIFPIKSYKILYLKNGPLKTYEVLYFCPFSIVNLDFHRSNEEISYKPALYIANKKAFNEEYFSLFSVVDEKIIRAECSGALLLETRGQPFTRISSTTIQPFVLKMCIYRCHKKTCVKLCVFHFLAKMGR